MRKWYPNWIIDEIYWQHRYKEERSIYMLVSITYCGTIAVFPSPAKLACIYEMFVCLIRRQLPTKEVGFQEYILLTKFS